MVKKILLLSGLSLSGLLSAGGPEAKLRTNMQKLKKLYDNACQAKREQKHIDWDTIINQTKTVADDFFLVSPSLTQNQRLSYTNQMYECAQLFEKLSDY
jgi:hypothetical protein